MFISRVFEWSNCGVWEYNVRQSHQKQDSQYTYIIRPCSWLRRLGSLAQALILGLGALFSERAKKAAKEFLDKAQLGYSVDITAKVDLILKEGISLDSQEDGFSGSSAEELQAIFLKSTKASLQMMALLGAGLEVHCPVLAKYLGQKAQTPGQRLSVYLQLVGAVIELPQGKRVMNPEVLEAYLVRFQLLQQGLSQPGWQIRAIGETGKLIACVGAAEFSNSIDLIDQLSTYRRLVYLQGHLELTLQNCEQVPEALLDFNQLKTVTIRDSLEWPESVSKIKRLQRINLLNCQFSECENLYELESLRCVEIKGHRSTSVPYKLCQQPYIKTLIIEGAISSVPIPGLNVETYWVQPNSHQIAPPKMKGCEKLQWFHWPIALVEEISKAGISEILPPRCQISYI